VQPVIYTTENLSMFGQTRSCFDEYKFEKHNDLQSLFYLSSAHLVSILLLENGDGRGLAYFLEEISIVVSAVMKAAGRKILDVVNKPLGNQTKTFFLQI